MKKLNSFIEKIRISAFMESFKFKESDELEDLTEQEFPMMANGIAAPDEIIEPTKNIIYL